MWGGHDELNRRSQLLAEIPLFGNLSPGELLQLATLLEAVCFEEEESIVEEGRLGDCMYVIVEGEPKVFVQGVGLVAQLAPGKYFGELSIVDAPASYRSATVMSVGPTKCLRLSQHDVHRLLSSAKCAEVLVVAKGAYDKRSRLRASELVRKATLKLWQLMVSESTRLSEHTTKTAVGRWQRLKRATIGGAVTREGYISMHLRISKVLVFGFSLETATDMATNDWAEDITAYSGDSKIDIWLEELKKKLREDTRVEVRFNSILIRF